MTVSLRSRSAILFSILLLSTGVHLRGGTRGTPNDLHRLIDKLFTKRIATRATTSVKIISAETGDVLYERNAQTPLTPASTMKLITSAAALVKLGLEYNFRTIVSTDGHLHGASSLLGNIYLRGFGDPYLGVEDLRELALSIRGRGVREIVGNVIGDESFFDHPSACSDLSGEERVSSRRPHLSALAINLNLLRVILAPAKKKGARVIVDSPAGIESFKVVNECITVNEKVRYRPAVRVEWSDEGCTLRILGKMALGSPARAYAFPVPSPAWYAAAIFREQLKAVGIEVRGQTILGSVPANAKELARKQSPISGVLTVMNKESDNFAAEMVLRTLAAEIKGIPGTVDKGVQVVREFLSSAGLPAEEFRIYDGSGMSHQNAVTADGLTALLRYMYTRDDLFEAYRMTLPSAGVDGTLRGRMIGTEAEGNLQAKTGSLNGVTSLSGYVTNGDGELIIFSITSADVAASKKLYRSLQDKIGKTLAGFSRYRGPTN